MRYIKKPVVVEALQWTGDNYYDMLDFCPSLIRDFDVPNATHPELYVYTLEGEMHLSVGDYLIKGVRGEYYPCKPDIFWETYDSID